VNRNALDRWPEAQPVGLLMLTGAEDRALSEMIAADPRAIPFWSATSENMLVGPMLDAPFERMHMIEVANAADARALVADLEHLAQGTPSSLLIAKPIPKRVKRVLAAASFLLHKLPAPSLAAALLDFPHALGDANPTAEQLQRFTEERMDTPILVLNLNLHKNMGVHPETGRPAPGRELANVYFRRGISTFSRLGARMVWAGSCQGARTDGIETGEWDQIGLVLYPSRQAFADLLRVPKYAASAPFRDAGLERSWVVQCRVTASSVACDVATSFTRRQRAERLDG
jgi:hypothetical protein